MYHIIDLGKAVRYDLRKLSLIFTKLSLSFYLTNCSQWALRVCLQVEHIVVCQSRVS